MIEEERLANEHWAFLQRWMELVFKDGFTHGFKHGVEYVARDDMDDIYHFKIMAKDPSHKDVERLGKLLKKLNVRVV